MAENGLADPDSVKAFVAPDTRSVEYNTALNIVPGYWDTEYHDIDLAYTKGSASFPQLARNRSLDLAGLYMGSSWCLSEYHC
jgi:hypothetical protein